MMYEGWRTVYANIALDRSLRPEHVNEKMISLLDHGLTVYAIVLADGALRRA